MKTTFILLAIVYGILFIPALRIAITFWLYKDSDQVANFAMKRGFLLGFLSILIVYPMYILKDCFNHGRG